MKKQYLLLSLMLFAFTFSNGQFVDGWGEPFEGTFSDWKTKSPKEYSGVYYFGASEGESSLRIIVVDDMVIAQHKYHDAHLDENGDFKDWKSVYKNFALTISGNSVKATGFNGAFKTYTINGQTEKGLVMYSGCPDFINENEFGIKSTASFSESYYGKYPFASYEILTDEQLSGYSKQELKIMRNEIFARYEYDFRDGGVMEKHFEQFEWYVPHYKDVFKFMTKIEKANIVTIQKAEKK